MSAPHHHHHHHDPFTLYTRLSGQIVTSPEKFRRQIIEIGQSLQHEQRDCKAAGKKLHDLTQWLLNIQDAQQDVNIALEAIHEVRNEVDKQKTMLAEFDSVKSKSHGLQSICQELQQHVGKQSRSIARYEEKVSTMRKQATQRAQDTQDNMENLHKQIVEAEAFRLQVKNRGERLEGEVQRLEAELEAENASKEQELLEIKMTYGKLEKKVIAHLQKLQRTLEMNIVLPSPVTLSPQERSSKMLQARYV